MKSNRLWIPLVFIALGIISYIISSSGSYDYVDRYWRTNLSKSVEDNGIPAEIFEEELRASLRSAESPFAKGDLYLVLGRLRDDSRLKCRSVAYYEDYIKHADENDKVERQLASIAHETIASLDCPNAKQSAAENYRQAARLQDDGLIARFDKSIVSNRTPDISVQPYELPEFKPCEGSKIVIGNSSITLGSDDLLVSQTDRVTRDWLSAQINQSPSGPQLLREFSERLSYGEADLRSDIGWHEGARIDELKSSGLQHQAATGTIAVMVNGTWYSPDENGVFRFEMLPDKIFYPTTRFLRDDIAIVVDTHGINSIVRQAIRMNATAVIGCCDHPAKAAAAYYLAGKGVKVICPTDRFVLLLLFSGAEVLGSPPIMMEDGQAVLGNRPIVLDRNRTVGVMDVTGDKPGLMYYDTPLRYFSALGQPTETVEIDDFGQMDRLTNLSVDLIGVRVFDRDDYESVRDWLNLDGSNEAVLFHSISYPYGYLLFQEFPEQTSFDDPNPVCLD